MITLIEKPNVTRFAEEIEYDIPQMWPGLPKFKRLSEAEDYNDFLSDTILSYASGCDWENGPGYISLVIGIRADGKFRAEAWKLALGADYVGTEEVLACQDALTFEEMREFACNASRYLTRRPCWKDSRRKLMSRFNMFSTPGRLFPYGNNDLYEGAISESFLNEDKQVKFGNEFNPQFGWVLVLAGGSASGKSFSADHRIQFSGDKIDADAIKELYVELIDRGKLRGDPNNPNNPKWPDRFSQDPKVQNGFTPKDSKELWSDVIQTDKKDNVISNPIFRSKKPVHHSYKLSDPNDTNLLHDTTYKTGWRDKMRNLPLTNDRKKWVDENGVEHTHPRLPNFIYDITGQHKSEFDKPLDFLKEGFGYKIAVVWVLADVQTAILNNFNRSRRVFTEVVEDIHRKVAATMTSLFAYPTKSVDEIWLLFNTQFINRIRAKYGDDVADYILANPALKLKKRNNKFEVPPEAEKVITILTMQEMRAEKAKKLITFKTDEELAKKVEEEYGEWKYFVEAFSKGDVDIKFEG